MKKILLAINGVHFSEGAFSFIKDLNEKQPVTVSAVLLPEVDYYDVIFSIGGVAVPVVPKEIEGQEDYKSVQARFECLCKANAIQFNIHADFETNAVNQLKMESRFADLLVIGSELFYENLGKAMQEDYIDSILHKSECPVVLVPENYEAPETIIMAYDASQSSTYAIKQFGYLFPEYCKSKILFVNAGEDHKIIPDLYYIKEYANCHFENHTFKRIETDPQKYFSTWIANYGQSMLVTGAYGRSVFSEMLRNSFITDTIRDHKLPIFIAHH